MALAKKDLPALTGLRFLAAAMVFLFHYADVLFPAADRPFAYYFFRQLNVGVSLFFVLSGFLITYRYYDFLSGGEPLRNYLLRRVARIFPLYWLVFFLHFFLVYVQQHRLLDVVSIFFNLILLHGFSTKYFFSGLTQSWSLTVEETFYLFAPFCFWLIRVRRLFLLQLPALFGIGFLLVLLSSFFPAGIFFGTSSFLFSGTFFGRCVEFFAGIYLARLFLTAPRRGTGVFFTLSGAAFFIGLLLALAALAYGEKQPGYNDSLPGILLFNFLLPLSIAGFYYGLLTEETAMKRWLSTNLVTLLGKSSYAFYLLHVGMIAEVFYFHVSANLILLFLFLQALSVLAYKFFEKPVYFFLLDKWKIKKHPDGERPLKNVVYMAENEKR